MKLVTLGRSFDCILDFLKVQDKLCLSLCNQEAVYCKTYVEHTNNNYIRFFLEVQDKLCLSLCNQEAILVESTRHNTELPFYFLFPCSAIYFVVYT